MGNSNTCCSKCDFEKTKIEILTILSNAPAGISIFAPYKGLEVLVTSIVPPDGPMLPDACGMLSSLSLLFYILQPEINNIINIIANDNIIPTRKYYR